MQKALRRHGRGRGVRYSQELKREVVAVVESRRADGHAWEAVVAELGMTYETLRRWCAKAKATGAGPVAMRPVEVVSSSTRSLTLVSPSGLRVEGASVEEIVALVRALG